MSSYFDITENSHKNMNIENHYKSMHFSVLLKTTLDLQQNSMFYSNKIQNNKKNCGISKTKSIVFYYKVPTTPPILPQNYVSKNNPSSLWAVPSHITMIQKQQEFKIQTNNVP